MAQYNYDETGAVFNFFLLTLLAMLLLPLTYYSLVKPPVPSTNTKGSLLKSDCDCDACAAKRSRLASQKSTGSVFSLRLLLLLLGWSLFAFIVYKAFTTEIEETGIWDPYQILGVDSSADESVIKKAFKKLSLKFHPDKVAPEEREKASNLFVDISKAYKVLTDEEARKVFDETGHPDGKQAFQLGLALPKWLVEKGNTSLVLLVYTIVFGITLPILVARWWSQAKHVTKNKVLNETMAMYYRDIKDIMPFKALIDVLSKSYEYQSMISPENGKAYDDLADEIRTAMESRSIERFDKKKTNVRDTHALSSYRASVLIYAHLLRIVPKNPILAAEQIKVVEAAPTLINGMLQIVTARRWLGASITIIEFSQMMVQALFNRQSPLMQLPFPDSDVLRHFSTKKRNITTLEQYFQLSDEEKRSVLRTLSEDQFNTIQAVGEKYPALKIVKAKYEVLGEPTITAGAIVNLGIKLRSLYGGKEPVGDHLTDELDDPEEESKKSQWWVDKTEKIREPHAPYFPGSRPPTYWVMLANQKEGHLICLGKVVGLDTDKTIRLQFQAPPKAGTWVFQVIVKSDTYAGTDQTIDAKLVVEDESALPAMEDDEDDISEPEDNSLAGQMNTIKTKGVAGALQSGSARDDSGARSGRRRVPAHLRQEYDDSSDSEDEDDDDEEAEADGGAGGEAAADAAEDQDDDDDDDDEDDEEEDDE
ncbi:Sec63 Brl domain-containing protein [Entophlyctis helioformis]|nr:Sec63 Brl domain-containing protein [Entophlyctis helioformis]